MVPSFITISEARKILVTGKSINFLREICQYMTSSSEISTRRIFETINGVLFYHFTTFLILLITYLIVVSVEALFDGEQGVQLQKAMDMAFRESSQRVLDIMRKEHRLFEHMQAFRNYLLLGQGDFIRYLLELIA